MSHEEAPKPLLVRSLLQFDDLVQKNELFYSPSTPEVVNDHGFELQFRIVSAFNNKPILSRKASARRAPPVGGPFETPDPAFVLAHIGATHVLQFNKYCVYRPQFILHTTHFAPQSDDLDYSDLAAAWEVLQSLEEPYIVFYNCGVDGGSSQGHKHMQLIPQPGPEEFTLFPDRAEIQQSLKIAPCDGRGGGGEDSEDEQQPIVQPPKSFQIPFECYVLPLPENIKSESSSTKNKTSSLPSLVHMRYLRLLAAAKQHRADTILTRTASSSNPSSSEPHPPTGAGPPGFGAYDFVLTKSWMTLVPRRHAGRDGVNTNAMGMMGLIWVKDREERGELG